MLPDSVSWLRHGINSCFCKLIILGFFVLVNSVHCLGYQGSDCLLGTNEGCYSGIPVSMFLLTVVDWLTNPEFGTSSGA